MMIVHLFHFGLCGCGPTQMASQGKKGDSACLGFTDHSWKSARGNQLQNQLSRRGPEKHREPVTAHLDPVT